MFVSAPRADALCVCCQPAQKSPKKLALSEKLKVTEVAHGRKVHSEDDLAVEKAAEQRKIKRNFQGHWRCWPFFLFFFVLFLYLFFFGVRFLRWQIEGFLSKVNAASFLPRLL